MHDSKNGPRRVAQFTVSIIFMYYLCPLTLLQLATPLSCCEWYTRWWFWPGSVGTWPLDGQEFTNLELGPAAFDTSAAGTLINVQNWFVLFHNVFIHLHAILDILGFGRVSRQTYLWHCRRHFTICVEIEFADRAVISYSTCAIGIWMYLD